MVDWELLKKRPPPLLSQQDRLLSQSQVLWEGGRHLSSSSLLYAVFSISADLMSPVLPGFGTSNRVSNDIFLNVDSKPDLNFLLPVMLLLTFDKDYFSRITPRYAGHGRTGPWIYLIVICKVRFHERSKNRQLSAFPVDSSHEFRFESKRRLHSLM